LKLFYGSPKEAQDQKRARPAPEPSRVKEPLVRGLQELR